MRVTLLTLPLLGLGHYGFGQSTTPAGEQKIKMSFASPPGGMPLLGLISSMPQRPSLDDSLARRFHARNRVKTVALVRVGANGAALDTLDYAELDRAGYPVLTAKPSFKARTHLRYNRRHQLISLTKDATPGFAWFVQSDYDPATRTTTTRVGPSLAQLALYQTGHDTQQGNTHRFETLLMAVPGMPAPKVGRVVLSTSTMGGDTLRIDVLGYQGEQVVKSEAYYAIGRQPQQREGGIIVLPTAGRPHRALEGKFISTNRSAFDAAGRLARIQYLPTPPALAEKPVTSTSADGNGSMTIRPSTDTLTTTYLRNADGQLLREEFHGNVFGKVFSSSKPADSPPFTAYDYLPNGLRRSKTDNHGTRYEYRYTFF